MKDKSINNENSYKESEYNREHADYSVCPCCGFKTLDPDDSAYEICPVCFWENDPTQTRHPDEEGANHVSLNKARENYKEFGACDKKYLEFVREPFPEEISADSDLNDKKESDGGAE
ncbi:MAG: hypothetical protein K5669_04095 [Lachnospiraceae bacterium]|nr:hypothetical protein [Lachnospiraceae bacterium]